MRDISLSSDLRKIMVRLKNIQKKYNIVTDKDALPSEIDYAIIHLNNAIIDAVIDEEIDKTDRGIR